MIKNPIIRGFNPDPSITYANGKYYIAVSTFEFFPGVTIYESSDLANWKYVSSALDREENLYLESCMPSSGGVYAATIRYFDGYFYVVTTNKNIKSNIITRSKSIYGPWEDIKIINNMGIDPSIFFDEDGSCFYTSNGRFIDSRPGIYGSYIDPKSGKLLGSMKLICEGDSKYATEAPHIYKKDGYYYLIVAEGGTEYNHHEVCFRSRDIYGPYEKSPYTMLSHVNRKDFVIQATGHADIIKTENGWISVFLAIRKLSKPKLHTLGRETFFAPVTWRDGWPIIGNDGYVEIEEEFNKRETIREKKDTYRFNSLSSYPFLKLRREKRDSYIVDGSNLTLLGDIPLDTPKGSPTALFLRQEESHEHFTATLDINTLTGAAGVVAFMTSEYYYRIIVTKESIKVEARVHALSTIVYENRVEKESIKLEIRTTATEYSLYADDSLLYSFSYAGLATEGMMYMNFTGVLFGIYAESGSATFIKEIEREFIS